MNMVLDDAVEIGKKRVEVGRILLKGDSITLIQEANPVKKRVEVGRILLKGDSITLIQ